jgi:dihydropyrimidinase
MKNDIKIIRNVYLIKNGKLLKKDIIIKKDRIYKLTKPYYLNIANAETYDCSNLIALPGLIDVHTHFKLKIGTNKFNSDNFINATKACISGGITTIIDFTHQKPGESLIKGLKERLKDAKKSFCDYSFHCIMPSLDIKNLESEFKKVIDNGITTFKIFTAYKERGLKLEDRDILKLMRLSKRYGVMITVHAEDEDLINNNLRKLSYFNRTIPIKYLPIIRNEKTELSAVKKIIELNQNVKSKLYFVHVSSLSSIKEINKARQKGLKIIAETCPQYLILDEKIYKGKNAYLYTFCPPTRNRSNNDKLWDYLNIAIKNVATDSCAFTRKQKAMHKNDLNKIYMGIASSQFLLSLIYTFGVKKGIISLSTMQKILCENPAAVMGIKDKGKIKKGFFADLCIFNPNSYFILDKRKILHNADYSPYEGYKLYGINEYTFLRGELAYKNGKISKKPIGQFIKRIKPKFI